MCYKFRVVAGLALAATKALKRLHQARKMPQNINRTLDLIVKILYRFGIWREWKGSAIRIRNIKGLYMFAYLLIEAFMSVCAFVSEDKNEFTFLCLVVVIVGVIGTKLVYLVLRKAEILRFLNKTTEHHGDMNEEHVKRMNFYLKFFNGYICMLLVAAIFYNVSTLPWVTMERKLPFFIRFTWKGSHSQIIYWICYVFLGLGVFYINISNLTTPIIWYLMLSFGVQYEILGDKLRKLGTYQMPPTKTRPTRDKTFLEDLIGLVKTHRNLVKTIGQFRACFFILFLIQMTTSGTSICVATYNLAFNSEKNFMETVIFAIVILYAFFDIFLIMYLGNEIKMASNRLSYCLFASNWTEQPTVHNKCMIIIGEVLKKPHELVIFVYPINLDTFTKIIKGAYTLFNVLQNFN